jgi:hypothetical protein
MLKSQSYIKTQKLRALLNNKFLMMTWGDVDPASAADLATSSLAAGRIAGRHSDRHYPAVSEQSTRMLRKNGLKNS